MTDKRTVSNLKEYLWDSCSKLQELIGQFLNREAVIHEELREATCRSVKQDGEKESVNEKNKKVMDIAGGRDTQNNNIGFWRRHNKVNQ